VKSLGRNLALALALGAAVYLILAVVSDLGAVGSALEGFDYALIPVILGLVLLSYVGRFVRWAYYLGVLKVSVPLGTNAAIFAAGLSMTISPGKLGEVLKSVFVREVSGAAISRTAPAVVAERITDGTGVVAWGLMGALAFSFGPGVLLAFLAIAALGIAILRSKRLSLLAERALLKVPLLDRLAPRVHVFHASSNELLATRPLIVGTVVSFLSWGLEILAVYLCAVGIGAQLPFLVMVFVFAVGSLVGVGSMLPGGIGAAEATMAGLFKFYAGLAAGLAVALTFVIRLVTLWFATLIGIAGLFVVRRLLGEAPQGTDL
jgi:glycosyltransferase 2 family protein